ncbi:MAG TPA: hypothetical protein PLQ93_08535, partial [Bacteroidia bacterium]|nr:hypothetical protein [Bacteroidia bacterium]
QVKNTKTKIEKGTPPTQSNSAEKTAQPSAPAQDPNKANATAKQGSKSSIQAKEQNDAPEKKKKKQKSIDSKYSIRPKL